MRALFFLLLMVWMAVLVFRALAGGASRIVKDAAAKGFDVISCEIDARYGAGTYLVKVRNNGAEELYNVSQRPFSTLQWVRLP